MSRLASSHCSRTLRYSAQLSHSGNASFQSSQVPVKLMFANICENKMEDLPSLKCHYFYDWTWPWSVDYLLDLTTDLPHHLRLIWMIWTLSWHWLPCLSHPAALPPVDPDGSMADWDSQCQLCQRAQLCHWENSWPLPPLILATFPVHVVFSPKYARFVLHCWYSL